MYTRRNPDVHDPDALWALIVNLAEQADPKLHRWMQRNERMLVPIIRAKVKGRRAQRRRVTSGAPAPVTMPLADAVVYARASAQNLVDDTVFVGDKMKKDDVGASGATYHPLQNYLMHPVEADIDVHMAAIETLREHSHRQLDRDTWERAYKAIREAWEAQNGTQTASMDDNIGPSTVYGTRSPKSGLSDGSQFRQERGRVSVRLPRRRGGKSGNELMRDAGIQRGRFQWAAGPGEYTRSWMTFDVDDTEEFAEALREEYPALSEALRQNARGWGAKSTSPAAPSRPSAAPSRPAFSIPARLDEVNYRVIFDVQDVGMNAKEFALAYGMAFGRIDGKWVAYAPTTDIEDVHVKLLGSSDARIRAWAETIARDVGQWAKHRATLEQSKEAGAASGGRWKLESDGKYVRVYADFIERDKRPAKLKKDDEGFYYRVSTKRLGPFTDKLGRVFPRLAEAINRAFGGMTKVVDESEKDMLKVMLDLNAAVKPADLRSPKAKACLRQVMKAWQARGPLDADLAPYPFQWVGITAAAMKKFRIVIGDAMGLGKTVQALGALIVLGDRGLPCLVVCPKNVVYNWAAEAQKWLSGMLDKREIKVLASTSKPQTGFRGLYICSYDYLRENEGVLVDFGFQTAVFDEAHYAKNAKSGRGAATQILADNVPFVLMMTGTPMPNRVSEMWALMNAVEPGQWGTFNAFKRKYAGEVKEIQTQAGAVITTEKGISQEHLDELQDRVKTAQIRRLKTDVLDLPGKTRHLVPVDITGKQRAQYEAAEEEFMEWLEAQTIAEMEAELAEEGRDWDSLSEGDHEEVRSRAKKAVETAMKAEIIVKMNRLRQLTAKFKRKPAVDMAHALLAKGPLIVWAYHAPIVKGMAQALADAGFRVAIIAGDTSAKNRQTITEQFQAGNIDAIVASTAAKEGLTLTKANQAMFVERYWTPADEVQAEDRIHRIGQDKPVDIYYLNVGNTIDDYMRQLVQSKADLTDLVMGDETVERNVLKDAQAKAALGFGDFVRRKNPTHRRGRR